MADPNPRAQEVLACALGLPPDQRPPYLRRACAGDGELLRQVEGFLAEREDAVGLPDRPTSAATPAGAEDAPTVPPAHGTPPPGEAGAATGGVVVAGHAGDTEGETLPPAFPPDAETAFGPAGPREGGRYQFHGEIARGGMGAVLRGRDTDLGRDIAVKVLLEAHRGRPELRQRFLEEARIGGQLQHPGVVPVYELGVFPDRRPYFTMKLVEGRTLADLLAARREPAQDRPHFVKVFEQVCQTVAYAHARGVIHRDLKPLNVMVGSFGEVQVMDWGLAKVLAGDGRAPAGRDGATPAVRPSDSQTAVAGDGTGIHTASGSVIGTPAYMPPEQARGEVDRLDRRSDVFGLGAILCEILTGRPPYAGDAVQVLCQAVDGDLADAFARLSGCGADAELIGLARRCLAADPAERPADAGVLAAAVTAYLESVEARLKQAELSRAAAEVRAAEERKRRKLVAGLAAAVLGLVTVAAGSGLWFQRQAAERRAAAARQEAERRQAVEAALDKVAGLERQSRWKEARAVLEQADARLGDAGPDDVRRRLEQARTDLTLVARLDAARLQTAALTEQGLDWAGAAEGYAAALREAGLGQPGEDVQAVAERVQGSAVRAQVIAALDDWARLTKDGAQRAWLVAVTKRADPDPWRDHYRDAALKRDRAALARLAREADVRRQSPQLLVALGATLRNAGGDAVPLLRAAHARYPDDFWLNCTLGDLLGKARRWDEAVGYYRAATALRPDAAMVHINLGQALQHQGRRQEALSEYRAASEIDPDHQLVHLNLATALVAMGRVDEALAESRKAVAGRARVLAPAAYLTLGNALKAQGRLKDAAAAYRQAVGLAPRLAAAHYALGPVLEALGRVDEAVTECAEAVKLDPDDPAAHSNFGKVLRAKGRLDEAVAEHRKAVALDPKLVPAHFNLGAALEDKGLVDEAVAAYRKAIDLDATFAPAHTNLGIVLARKGMLTEALAELRTALALEPDNPEAHINLAHALADKGRRDQAVAEYRKALVLAPKSASAHYGLGTVLVEQGLLNEALTEYRRAVELDPRHVLAHVNLANVFKSEGHLDEAVGEYRRALELDPKHPMIYYNLGIARAMQGRHREAARAYRQAVRLKPDLAEAYCNLGDSLKQLGRFTESAAAFRRGHELGSVRPDWRYPSAEWVRTAERLAELDRKLPALLGGEARPADTGELIEYVRLCHLKKHYAAAARLWLRVFAAEPKRAEDLKAGFRYDAACAAALVGSGQGEGASGVASEERARWRRQAREWLAADLARWHQTLKGGSAAERAAVLQTLRHWQEDGDLAGVRDPAALSRMSADEAKAFARLWADVQALLKK